VKPRWTFVLVVLALVLSALVPSALVLLAPSSLHAQELRGRLVAEGGLDQPLDGAIVTLLKGEHGVTHGYANLMMVMGGKVNGGVFLGMNGVVIKSHGGADALAFQQAIHVAMVEVDKDVPEQIRFLMEEQGH